jgi:uncharacterized protein (DUF305 family)
MRAIHFAGAAATFLAVACAAPVAAQGGHGHHNHAPPAAPAPGDSARWTEADVRFITHMIGHHGQAMEMARLAPQRAGAGAIHRLAERILNAQQDEIASMQTWLRDRGRPAPEPVPTERMQHQDGHAMMPGMLTPAQMNELEAARGPEFDRLFLTRMIEHHRGAVSMVSELFGSYGAGQDDTVFKLASDINVDQVTEIARMQRMLADLIFGSPSQ